MNTYACFFGRRKVEVDAETTYAAQQEAARLLGLSEKKRMSIEVILIKKDGRAVELHPGFLP